MFGEWHVQIISTPGYLLNKIYLMTRSAKGTVFLLKDGETVLIPEGSASKEDPYFTEMSDDQLQALANALAKRGVKTTNDSKNEGLLQATTAHLEDMRKLVFKGKQK